MEIKRNNSNQITSLSKQMITTLSMVSPFYDHAVRVDYLSEILPFLNLDRNVGRRVKSENGTFNANYMSWGISPETKETQNITNKQDTNFDNKQSNNCQLNIQQKSQDNRNNNKSYITSVNNIYSSVSSKSDSHENPTNILSKENQSLKQISGKTMQSSSSNDSPKFKQTRLEKKVHGSNDRLTELNTLSNDATKSVKKMHGCNNRLAELNTLSNDATKSIKQNVNDTIYSMSMPYSINNIFAAATAVSETNRLPFVESNYHFYTTKKFCGLFVEPRKETPIFHNKLPFTIQTEAKPMLREKLHESKSYNNNQGQKTVSNGLDQKAVPTHETYSNGEAINYPIQNYHAVKKSNIQTDQTNRNKSGVEFPQTNRKRTHIYRNKGKSVLEVNRPMGNQQIRLHTSRYAEVTRPDMFISVNSPLSTHYNISNKHQYNNSGKKVLPDKYKFPESHIAHGRNISMSLPSLTKRSIDSELPTRARSITAQETAVMLERVRVRIEERVDQKLIQERKIIEQRDNNVKYTQPKLKVSEVITDDFIRLVTDKINKFLKEERFRRGYIR